MVNRLIHVVLTLPISIVTIEWAFSANETCKDRTS